MLCWGCRGEMWGSSSCCYFFLTFHLSLRLCECLNTSEVRFLSLPLYYAPWCGWWSDVGMRKRGCGLARRGSHLLPPPSPFLLPPHPLPSSPTITVEWKTFFSAGGGNSKIRWMVGWLLDLLQGTGSFRLLWYCCAEGMKVTGCVFICVQLVFDGLSSF